jgi:hypothetical protein
MSLRTLLATPLLLALLVVPVMPLVASAAEPPLVDVSDPVAARRIAVDERGWYRAVLRSDGRCRLVIESLVDVATLTRSCAVRDVDITSDAEGRAHVVFRRDGRDGRPAGIWYSRWVASGLSTPVHIRGTGAADRQPVVAIIDGAPDVFFTRRQRDGGTRVMRVDAPLRDRPTVHVRNASAYAVATYRAGTPVGTPGRVEVVLRRVADSDRLLLRVNGGAWTELFVDADLAGTDVMIGTDGYAWVVLGIPTGPDDGGTILRIPPDLSAAFQNLVTSDPVVDGSIGRAGGAVLLADVSTRTFTEN